MLKKLLGWISEEVDSGPREWDDDPVARKTAWSPKKGGGANFRTHRLEKRGVTRLEFRLTTGAKLFCWVFIVMGGGIPLFMISMGAQDPDMGAGSILFLILIGTVFVGVGFGLRYFMGKPRVFDKASGYFWRGQSKPDGTRAQGEADSRVALNDIYALQLLREYVSGDKSSYYSYELNLVLNNGRRVNVTDHGSLRRLQEDARTLARFLGVPVWDAT